MLRAWLGVVLSLAVGVALPAPAEAGDCLLAEPARPDVVIYEQTWRDERMPSRHRPQGAGELVAYALEERIRPTEAVRACGLRRVRGKSRLLLDIAGVPYYAAPEDFVVVEDPGEARAVPAVPLDPDVPLCHEFVVGPAGADLFRAPDGEPLTHVREVHTLQAGAVFGAARRARGFWLGLHAGLRGFVAAPWLVHTGRKPACAYFQGGGPFFYAANWSGLTRRTTYLYVDAAGTPVRAEDVLPPASPVTVRGLLAGREAGLDFLHVTFGGASGLVPRDAVTIVSGPELAEPRTPLPGCRAADLKVPLLLARCAVEALPVSWLDRTVKAPLPQRILLPEGLRVPELGQIGGAPEVLAFGLRARVPGGVCMQRTEQVFPLCFDREQRPVPRPGPLDVAARPTGFRLVAPARPPAPEVSGDARALLNEGLAERHPDGLLGRLRDRFPIPDPTVADLDFLGTAGFSRKFLRAVVVGVDAAASPLEKAVQTLCTALPVTDLAPIAEEPTAPGTSAPPRVAQTVHGPRPRQAQLRGCLPFLGVNPLPGGDIDCARQLLDLGLCLPAREALIEASTHAGSAEKRRPLLHLYREAARRCGPSPRVHETLAPYCLDDPAGGDGLACWLAMAGLVEQNRAEDGLPLAEALDRQASAPPARARAVQAVVYAAAGYLDRAAMRLATAARDAATDPRERRLFERIHLQLARAAAEAGEPDVAFQVLERFAPHAQAAHFDLVLPVAFEARGGACALAALRRGGCGALPGMARDVSLLWAAQLLHEEACAFDEAARICETAGRCAASLRPTVAALQEALGQGGTTAELVRRVERTVRLRGLRARQLREFDDALGSDGQCTVFDRGQREVRALRTLTARLRADVPPETLAAVERAAVRAEFWCRAALQDGLGRLQERLAWLAQRAETVAIDILDHQEEELDVATRAVDALETVARERLRADLDRFARGLLPGWDQLVRTVPLGVQAPPFLRRALSAKPLGADQPAEFPTCHAETRTTAASDGQLGDVDLGIVRRMARRSLTCLSLAAARGEPPAHLLLLMRYNPALALASARDIPAELLAALPPPLAAHLARLVDEGGRARPTQRCLTGNAAVRRLLTEGRY